MSREDNRAVVDSQSDPPEGELRSTKPTTATKPGTPAAAAAVDAMLRMPRIKGVSTEMLKEWISEGRR
jgi:hypothetical protein